MSILAEYRSFLNELCDFTIVVFWTKYYSPDPRSRRNSDKLMVPSTPCGRVPLTSSWQLVKKLRNCDLRGFQLLIIYLFIIDRGIDRTSSASRWKQCLATVLQLGRPKTCFIRVVYIVVSGAGKDGALGTDLPNCCEYMFLEAQNQKCDLMQCLLR